MHNGDDFLHGWRIWRVAQPLVAGRLTLVELTTVAGERQRPAQSRSATDSMKASFR
jgi:hypothetical protein